MSAITRGYNFPKKTENPCHVLEGDQAAGGSQVRRRQETALEVAASQVPRCAQGISPTKIHGKVGKKTIREAYHLVTWGC